jgi:hypothetical protein
LFQFVGITSTQRFRDKRFNSVGQSAVRGGHTYLRSNVKRTSLRFSSKKECSFVPENGHGVIESRVRLLSVRADGIQCEPSSHVEHIPVAVHRVIASNR